MVIFPHSYHKLLQRTHVCLELNPQEFSMGSSSIASFTPPNTIYPKGSTLPLNMTCSHKWDFPTPLLRATFITGYSPESKEYMKLLNANDRCFIHSASFVSWISWILSLGFLTESLGTIGVSPNPFPGKAVWELKQLSTLEVWHWGLSLLIELCQHQQASSILSLHSDSLRKIWISSTSLSISSLQSFPHLF